MKVVVLFDRFGPYHISRLEAAAKYVTIFALEVYGETSEYQWDKVTSEKQINRITLFEKEKSSDISIKKLQDALCEKLAAIQPDVVAINGWADKAAISSLDWCLQNKTPAILMSESAEGDEKRTFWKELIKRQIVNKCSTALVGGTRHVEYLLRLGMDRENIFLGYDVVDNNYFFRNAMDARKRIEFWRSEKKLPEKYFLIVSRFIEKKNLPFVIEAYHQYFKQFGDRAWHLFIVGDGPLKTSLIHHVNKLGLQAMVHFEGFKQYDELPVYFGLAKVLLHASTTEQWGLVVNEAMACGLPVAISDRCGCVPELVHSGRNGFSFDPYKKDELVTILKTFTDGTHDAETMGEESLKIISDWDAEAFGVGLYHAAVQAKRQLLKQHTLTSKILLRLLTKR